MDALAQAINTTTVVVWGQHRTSPYNLVVHLENQVCYSFPTSACQLPFTQSRRYGYTTLGIHMSSLNKTASRNTLVCANRAIQIIRPSVCTRSPSRVPTYPQMAPPTPSASTLQQQEQPRRCRCIQLSCWTVRPLLAIGSSDPSGRWGCERVHPPERTWQQKSP